MHLEPAIVCQVISCYSTSGHGTPRKNASGPCGQLLRSHLSSLSLFCLSPQVGLFLLYCLWSFQIKALFLMTEEVSPKFCPTHLHFCPFIWAATGSCVARCPHFLFADKVRPKDVKRSPKAPVYNMILFLPSCVAPIQKNRIDLFEILVNFLQPPETKRRARKLLRWEQN